MTPKDFLDTEHRRLKRQLNIIESNVKYSPGELISLSCQIMCISICGSLEQCLKKIFVEYASIKSKDKLTAPVERLFKIYRNPTPDQILEILGDFDRPFKNSLKNIWHNQESFEKDLLNQLVSKRNLIAHQTGKRLDVSTEDLKNYLNAYSTLLSRVHNNFLGENHKS